MKKTAEEIYTEWFGSPSHTTRRSPTKQNVIDAMEEYALEAIKHDRERVVKNAKVKEVKFQSGFDPRPWSEYVVDKESILNLPIELK